MLLCPVILVAPCPPLQSTQPAEVPLCSSWRAEGRCFSQTLQSVNSINSQKREPCPSLCGMLFCRFRELCWPRIANTKREPSKVRSRRSCWVVDLGEGIRPHWHLRGQGKEDFPPSFPWQPKPSVSLEPGLLKKALLLNQRCFHLTLAPALARPPQEMVMLGAAKARRPSGHAQTWPTEGSRRPPPCSSSFASPVSFCHSCFPLPLPRLFPNTFIVLIDERHLQLRKVYIYSSTNIYVCVYSNNIYDL